MKFIIFLIVIPLVYSELHSFITTYTGIRSHMIAGIPEFSTVSTLDGQQIDYYDSYTMKLIPKQDWMKEFASKDMWKEDTEIRLKVQQIYINNIPVLMKRFNQSKGVHVFQRMYGCVWDDETRESRGFDEYAYDGEVFISLNLTEARYTAHVRQANHTVMKWNNDKTKLEFLQQYLRYECLYWLKEFWHQATFEKADPPKVSLLQKNPDYYVECHVTGFLFKNTTISWRKNGQDINSSSKLVKSKDTLPNEDGTFQKTLTLYVIPDDWKEDQYACVVEHQSLTEPVQKILTVNEIESNKPASYIMHPGLLVIIASFIAYNEECSE
ncbi:major histocompatibility complex class I-related gene protein-like [Pseudorasbora parva]|uniref:major histocompatibility complex class I-related gene protein-like n=1 Tax=Pseudorasbora parva TaxID=51549 RepID=UPI00351E2780